FPGFVINDFDVPFVAEGIDLVDAAGEDHIVFHGKLESFFLFEYLRRVFHDGGLEDAELLEAILLVALLLIIVFEASRFPFGFVNSGDVIPRDKDGFAQLIDEAADSGMHDGAESEHGSRPFAQSPQMAEKIALRTGAIAAHGRRAESKRFWRRRMEGFRPICDPRKDFRRVRRYRKKLGVGVYERHGRL